MTIDDVYRLFGKTSHWASILEEQLGNICMLNERVINQDKYKHGGTKLIVERIQELTIGALIKKIKNVLGKEQDSDVDKIFRPALKKRNYLIHHFFIDHQDNLKSHNGIPKVLAELKEIECIISQAAKIATEMCTERHKALNSAAQPIIPPDAAR